ncbi:MAG: FmdB family zinc ribbon protein [Roseiarcus sp.]
MTPPFVYRCESCNAEFELLVRASDVPACPSCGSDKLRQQIARICSEIKHTAIEKAGRGAAAHQGHLGNFTKE